MGHPHRVVDRPNRRQASPPPPADKLPEGTIGFTLGLSLREDFRVAMLMHALNGAVADSLLKGAGQQSLQAMAAERMGPLAADSVKGVTAVKTPHGVVKEALGAPPTAEEAGDSRFAGGICYFSATWDIQKSGSSTIPTMLTGIGDIHKLDSSPMAAPVVLPTRIETHSLLAQIGDTPLLRLERVAADLPGIEIFGKAEFQNPGGSVKDRPALNMIREGERTGALQPGKIILDATSGNTGIAYAMIGAALGYAVKLCLPANASPERKRILKAYGAEIVFTDPAEGTDGAIRKVRQIYENEPDRYFYPDQYNNAANWQAHYKTTAVEIIRQTHRRITHFVAGLGTSGTCMGVTRRLREEMPDVRSYSLQPSTGFHGLEGLKHMPTAIVPGIYQESLVDGNLWIETEDAHRMVRRLAREEGILAGVSAGANVAGARLIGKELAARGETGVIVTVLCDGAEKYLSEHFWDDSD